ncbi:MAG: hypothetical protein R3327_08060, partial [Nitrosopumilaceae archaeon]|nr:hypothetical protein [Nitrosopumilaceae archaeon]
ELKKKSNRVKLMPVVFKADGRELNSRSFPFNFTTRKKMLESIFENSIDITEDYAFYAPFKKYMPPLLSPKSWELRKQILHDVKGDFFSYTGDKTEGYMLKIYRLKPKIGKRKSLSASSVKEKMYDAAMGKNSDWKSDVPEKVANIIEENWDVVKKYANAEDTTTRVAGMKFPKEGWSK